MPTTGIPDAFGWARLRDSAPSPGPGAVPGRSAGTAPGRRAAEVGQLTGRLAELAACTDDRQADLAARREDAASALDDVSAACAAGRRPHADPRRTRDHVAG